MHWFSLSPLGQVLFIAKWSDLQKITPIFPAVTEENNTPIFCNIAENRGVILYRRYEKSD